MINLKVFIFLESEPQLPMIEIAIQPQKTLEQVGQFLYSDQKIHFQQYLFTSRPIIQDQLERQTDIVFPNNCTVQQATKRCLKEESKPLIILYNRKQQDRKDKIKKINSKNNIKSNQEINISEKKNPEQCCIIF